MNKNILIAIGGVIVIGLALYFGMHKSGTVIAPAPVVTEGTQPTTPPAKEPVATKPTTTTTKATEVTETATLKVGQTKVINGVSVTLNRVLGDSRCPTDVACVVAGAVDTNVTLKKLGIQTESIRMASNVPIYNFGTYVVAIKSVTPGRTSTVSPLPADYVITFSVHNTKK